MRATEVLLHSLDYPWELHDPMVLEIVTDRWHSLALPLAWDPACVALPRHAWTRNLPKTEAVGSDD